MESYYCMWSLILVAKPDMICPWWSHDPVSSHISVLHRLQYNFHEDLFCDLIGHGGEAVWSVLPRILLMCFFKTDVVSRQSLGPSSDSLVFKTWQKLAQCLNLLCPSRLFIGSHGLLYAQVPQVIWKLIYYNSGDFIPPISAWKFGDLTDVGREITSENWGTEKMF